MNWCVILKAENWEFVYLPNADWVAQFRPPDTIALNLRLIYEGIINAINRDVSESGVDTNITIDNAHIMMNHPVIGPLVEEFIIDQIIGHINHEVLHEANYLTNLHQEVLDKLGREEKHFMDLLWNTYITKFYDEFFVRLLNGGTYDKALMDSATYVDGWVNELVEQFSSSTPEVMLIGIQTKDIIITQFKIIGKKIAKYLMLRQEMFVSKIVTLMESDRPQDTIDEILQLMQDASPLSEDWKKILEATQEGVK